MIKKMLVNATHPEENRVAIVEDGILSELDIEIAGKEQTKGNIYKATVIRVETGLQAAFVDYGAERLGFLQIGEIHSSLFPKRDEESRGRPRINDILHRGQELLVQIIKEERGSKGAALTTFLSLPGRYMVLMPGDKTRGMSRKIPDGAERKQLKQAMGELQPPEEMGFIVRTAALGQSVEELKRDLNYLLRVYQNILDLSRQIKAPALVYRESNLVIRSIRDYFTHDMDEVLVDDPKVFQEARDFFQQVMPEYARLVKLHQERRPIFSKYQIEEQIETISRKQVPLPSGGSIVIDTTEALVAIDVNSGKLATEQGVEGTAYKTNLEAADEAARQLRLRDLGGLVVLDFIDMRDRKHIREVENRLKEALKKDKARVTVGRISQFGLLEMSRQRIKAALAEGAYNICPHCGGGGRVKSTEAQAVAVLRKLYAGIAKGSMARVDGKIPREVSEYLLNYKRDELHDMERRHNLQIYLRGTSKLIPGQFELEFHKREKEEKKAAETEPVTAALPLAETPLAEAPPAESPTTAEKLPEEETPAASAKSRGRRRRRGSKSPATGEAAPDSRSEQDSSQAREAEKPTPATEDPPPEAAASEKLGEPAASTPGEEPEPKRGTSRSARRRRSRAAKAAAAAATGETPPPDSGAAAGEPQVKTGDTTPLPSEGATQAEGKSAASGAEKTVATSPAETPKKPRRPARRRKPALAKTAAPGATGEARQPVQTDSGSLPGEDGAPRQGQEPAAPPATVVAAASPGPETPPAEQSSTPDPQKETTTARAEAPKKTRRPTRRGKPAEVKADSKLPGAESPAGEKTISEQVAEPAAQATAGKPLAIPDPAAPKPKSAARAPRKRPARKPAAQTSAKTGEATPKTPAPEGKGGTEAKAEKPPAKAKTSRPRKKQPAAAETDPAPKN